MRYEERYNYKALEIAAIEFGATKEEINALGGWFAMYGDQYWDGERWMVDKKQDLYLYPIYRKNGEDEFEIIGYTFSNDPDERFVQ